MIIEYNKISQVNHSITWYIFKNIVYFNILFFFSQHKRKINKPEGLEFTSVHAVTDLSISTSIKINNAQ